MSEHVTRDVAKIARDGQIRTLKERVRIADLRGDVAQHHAEEMRRERDAMRVERDKFLAQLQSTEAKLRDKDEQRVREERRANVAESELRRANLALVAALIGGGR